MVGKPGPQNRRHDDPVVDRLDGRFAQRVSTTRGESDSSFEISYAVISPIRSRLRRKRIESVWTLTAVADLRDELVEDGVLSAQSMQGHMGMRFGGQ